jgi:S-adenosylmethionine synthetase
MIRTAEFVSPKHPDKICDRISDKILDTCLEQDSESRVAVETVGGHKQVYLTGEITTNAKIDYTKIVKEVCEQTKAQWFEFTVLDHNIVEQSNEIARGVDTGGAGDQGIMVGYACDDNEEYVPEEYRLARSLCRHLYNKFPYDGKTQVTTRNDKNLFIVTSFQNVDRITLHNEVSEWLKGEDYGLMLTHANPAGDWEQGGFDADAGLTGRKLVVDNYGPRVPIGGGAYSGKDPSKVDRSAAYMARHIAKKELIRKGCKEVWVYLSYAIGLKEPLQMTCMDDVGNTWDIPSNYPVYPNEIIKFLDLKKPIYYETAHWGAYGNGFKWDK